MCALEDAGRAGAVHLAHVLVADRARAACQLDTTRGTLERMGVWTAALTVALLMAPALAAAQARPFPSLGANAGWRMRATLEDLNEIVTTTMTVDVRVTGEQPVAGGGRVVRLQWSGPDGVGLLPQALAIDTRGMRIAETAEPILPVGFAGLTAEPRGSETVVFLRDGLGCFHYSPAREIDDETGEVMGDGGTHWELCFDATGVPRRMYLHDTMQELDASQPESIGAPVARIAAAPPPPVVVPAEAPPPPRVASVAGTWLGHVTVGANQVRYQLDLRQMPAGITGTVIINGGVYEVAGTSAQGRVSLRGVRVRRAVPGMCMATLELALQDGTPQRLHGTWGPLAAPSGCPPPHTGRVDVRFVR